ncbi:bifunctional diguanylate cyclase/phosphodiesterase [Roseibium sp. RKSG952]|uniref:putative bifunctional diguanylate cyclase/phosphodiesterase n=1 Tax=Roseibium sp. RKSG952 TaxID=2529384 RepID=UPI0012BC1B1D|nr:EAL domain-containing protein [Roseibium sp. RKSG952]MTI00605.1 EAL domain-containing protein [Roseibium sp. RKSG952]
MPSNSKLNAFLGLWGENGRRFSKPVQAIFLLFLAVGLAALSTQNSFNEYWHLRASVDSTVPEADHYLRLQGASISQNLERTLNALSVNEAAAIAMAGNNREDLQRILTATFPALQQDDTTRFTLYDKDLSVRYSGNVEEPNTPSASSYLAKRAKSLGRTVHGLEYGGNAMPAITVVKPWFIEGSPIGYLQLDLDITYPLTALGPILNTDVIKVIDASSLAAHDTSLSNTTDWIPAGRFLVQSAEGNPIPEAALETIKHQPEKPGILDRVFFQQGRVEYLHALPVNLSDGTQATSIYFLQDITEPFRGFVWSAGLSLFGALVLAGLGWFCFRTLIRSVETRVIAVQEKLEREVAEDTADLEYHRNLLQEAQRITSVGSFERNLQTGELFWSKELYRIVGIPMDTDPVSARKALYRMIPPAERTMVEQAIQQAVDTLSDFDFEHQILAEDGASRFVHLRGYVVADETGKAKTLFGTVHDITDRQKAQQQNQMLANILEASLNEIYILNASTFRIEYANECARKNLGYPAQELSQLQAWEISPRHTERSFREMIEPAFDGTVPLLNVEGLQRRKDGSTYPVEVRFQLHKDRSKTLMIAIANDLTERTARELEIRASKEEAERMAYFDALTQLPNRAACQRDAKHLFASDAKDKPDFIIHLDIDNFKRINDTYGHVAGDGCLEEAGERLRICCTDMGRVYRWGGDEFVIVVKNSRIEPEELCERLNLIMRAPMEFEGNQVWPSVSMGIAKCPQDGETFETLLAHADLALYKSKEEGKDRWFFYTEELKNKSQAETRLEQELRSALHRNELFLVFQPQVNLRTGEVTGVETLLRWQHVDRGVLLPAAFLPVAEKSNLALLVGEVVINKALSAARKWMDMNLDFGRIAINLSPLHLVSGTLLSDFSEAMKKHDVGPERITAEVLESVFLDDEKAENTKTLEALHRLGMHIELDDFGTGFASLSHVADLPINGLKVDRSFTDKLLKDSKKEVVVNQLVHLARSLNINVVCEGVETRAQFERLRMMGNFSVQGYLIARPMPFDEMTDWLSSAPADIYSVL